jgi:probable rRNA maturation factor
MRASNTRHPKNISVKCHGIPARAVPRLTAAAQAVLASEGVTATGVITVVLLADQDIRKMNRRFRKVNRITDIISFRVADEPFLGDLYIGAGRSRAQAARVGHSWEQELVYLVLHGVLHLLGYTDYTPAARKKMFKKQDALFACLSS